jgi:hypothetical protein
VRGDDVIDSTSGSNLITILINTTDINRLPFAFGRRTPFSSASSFLLFDGRSSNRCS